MFIDAADRISEKAQKYGKCAVFVINGKVVSVGNDLVSYKKTLKSSMSKLLGVYTDLCPISWIVEDLAWAEENMVVKNEQLST